MRKSGRAEKRRRGGAIKALWALTYAIWALGLTLIIAGLLLDSTVLWARGFVYFAFGVPILFTTCLFYPAMLGRSPIWGWREALRFAWGIAVMLFGVAALFALKGTMDIGLFLAGVGVVMAIIVAKIGGGKANG